MSGALRVPRSSRARPLVAFSARHQRGRRWGAFASTECAPIVTPPLSYQLVRSVFSGGHGLGHSVSYRRSIASVGLRGATLGMCSRGASVAPCLHAAACGPRRQARRPAPLLAAGRLLARGRSWHALYPCRAGHRWQAVGPWCTERLCLCREGTRAIAFRRLRLLIMLRCSREGALLSPSVGASVAGLSAHRNGPIRIPKQKRRYRVSSRYFRE